MPKVPITINRPRTRIYDERVSDERNNDNADTITESEMPDPMAAPSEYSINEEPQGEAAESDPTIPGENQIMNNHDNQFSNGNLKEDQYPTPAENSEGMPAETLGNTTQEMEGPAGAGITGGEITNPQDAEESLRKNLQERQEEGEMQQRQMEGEVEVQRHDLKPSPGNPEEGLPPNPTGKENSGGSDETATEGDAMSTEETSASGGEVSRATSANSGEADERFLRAVADLENFKRQAQRREIEVRERAVRNVIEDLLPVMDNFERALDAAKNSSDVNSLRVGVEFIAQQLRDALKGHGIEPIESEGQNFDPLRHEALEEVSDTGQPEGTVIGEVQRGYAFKGQVIRPSRVRVAGK